MHGHGYDTVNSEIFARVYFRETSHRRSFVKIKSSRNGEIILPFTDIVNLPLSGILNVANMFINAIHENKILAKMSELTVLSLAVWCTD